MEDFALIIVLLAIVGIVLSLLGIIKGSIKTFKIKGRKKCSFLLMTCFVLFVVGVIIYPSNTSDITQTDNKASNVVKSSISDELEETSYTSDKEHGKETSLAVLNKDPVIEVQGDSGNSPAPKGMLEVHFIDVKQGASQLIISPSGKVMLIDGGDNDNEQRIVNYLKEQGIKKIDILVGTHPDSDHTGGLDAAVDAFDIGTIYMPKISSNTKTFESLLNSIAKKNLKVSTAKAGIDLTLDDQLVVKMIAPVKTYDDSNNMSTVIKLTFGNNSFLFTGDAEIKSENDLLANGTDLRSDVLLVAHHGSNSSSSMPFLDAVNPSYAVIQVGENNYGHPTNKILNRLIDKKIKIFRNDKQGTIVFSSDGNKISVSQNEWDPTTSKPAVATTKPKEIVTPKPTPKPTPKATPIVEAPAAETYDYDTSEVYYKNCTAVREAGAAPIYRGEPGYSTKLDRDGDGIACE